MSDATPKEDPTLARLAIALALPPVLRADLAIVRRAVEIAIGLDGEAAGAVGSARRCCRGCVWSINQATRSSGMPCGLRCSLVR